MNNLSIMLFPYHRGLVNGEWTAAELLQTFGDAGIVGIELMQNTIWKDAAKWEEFDSAVKAQGMVYSCYDVMVDLVGETAEAREQAIQTALEAIAYARDILACPNVLLAGTKPRTGMSEAVGRRIYAESLERVIDQAGDCGVTVTIEDFGVYPHFTAAGIHCLEVLQAVGREEMRFTFDNGNFLLGDDRPMDVFDALYPYTSHVHIKDFTPRSPDEKPSLTSPNGVSYKGCLIGEGDGQVHACVEKLRRVGYDGWISLEMGSGDVVGEAIHGARVVAEAWEQA